MTITWFQGPAGTGKTTAGIAYLEQKLAAGVQPRNVLILLPQQTLSAPWKAAKLALAKTDPNASTLRIATVAELAKEMLERFWPLVAEDAGFEAVDNPPTFLNLEAAQYYMAEIARPLIEQHGYFASVTMDRNRLYSQLIDNLNKASANGFSIKEIATRLQPALGDDESNLRIFADAQDCALRYRQYCLDHNLLDFSLTMQIFSEHLWPHELVQNDLRQRYTHLIFDNIEEDTPAAADFLRDWLPTLESALLIYDTDAGFRVFLGADPTVMLGLSDLATEQRHFTKSYTSSAELSTFAALLRNRLGKKLPVEDIPFRTSVSYEFQRFLPQMTDWAAQDIANLVHNEGVAPNDIVVLAPFLSDALRYSLSNRLTALEVPVRSNRPSRSLRDEQATTTLLTFAAIAHTDWSQPPTRYEVAQAMHTAIDTVDPVRAQLISKVLYNPKTGELREFANLKPEMQTRIGYRIGEQYETLRSWLVAYQEQEQTIALDHFLSLLFGEVLSQPTFGFHQNFDAAQIATYLVQSVRNFRRTVGTTLTGEPHEIGRAYLQTLHEGLLAASYPVEEEAQNANAVLIAPAYTFLLRNEPVKHQFWLNVNARGWGERIGQPVTHPYVLRRGWPSGKLWTDQDEMHFNRDQLQRLIGGLVQRCSEHIHMGITEIDERGNEYQGMLVRTLAQVLRQQGDVSA